MSLHAGARIGAYEIVSLLGAGGMGEVFRARDTKLNRDVAIKVLLAEVAGDPERLARFHREAQLLASLNHPHIAAIYGVEDARAGQAATLALVMELVGGSTLADRLASGPIPVDEALADRPPDCRSARSRPRPGHRPSRPETCERQGARRWHRQGARFRARESVGFSGRIARERHDVADPLDARDAGRAHPRHGGLHGAGAGAGTTGRSTRRHLGLRRHRVRDARRPAGVRRRRHLDHARGGAQG